MRTERVKNSKQSSWPKRVVRKWLNMKNGDDEFHSDYSIRTMADKSDRRKSCSDGDCYVFVPQDFSGWLMEAANGFQRPEPAVSDSLNTRMFVGTWNVGGRSPHEGLNLRHWLTSPAPAHIYVLGFQEIVPLNAGNVLGAEDNGPAAKWLSLIRSALNGDKTYSDVPQYYDEATAADLNQSYPKPRVSFSDLLTLEDGLEEEALERVPSFTAYSNTGDEGSTRPSCVWQKCDSPKRRRYCLAASKQMVGLFLCVWVRTDVYRHISNLKVSCVGRGIMGYLGNKGSISISMRLHQTTFCFVCTHLTSGEKEGDEVRRNSDVTEILKRTRFSHSCVPGQPVPPDTIVDHEKIIWLGDLNYRLVSSFGDSETHELLKKNDWQALLEKDQLRIEQRAGRVFKGWEEGRIYFAPTYKYLTNSDTYAVQTSKSKEKRRTPAWCDRILWRGDGLKQMCYVRGESRFSDHRPVYALFSVQVHEPNTTSNRCTAPKPSLPTPTPTALSSTCVARVQAEELLLIPRSESCFQSTPII